VDWSLWGAFGAGAVALYQRVAAVTGEMGVDWIDSPSACPLCQQNAAGSPYAPEDVPPYPGHGGCRCDLQPDGNVPLSFFAGYLG